MIICGCAVNGSITAVDASGIVRCPDKETQDRMMEQIIAARDSHDSIGGVVSCVCRNVPSGLGEPCFEKLEAKIETLKKENKVLKQQIIGYRKGNNTPKNNNQKPAIGNKRPKKPRSRNTRRK